MMRTTTFISFDPIGRIIPRALLVSAFTGDVAQYATGRLLQGCAAVLSFASCGKDEDPLRRIKQDEAAMRSIGVQIIRPPNTALTRDSCDTHPRESHSALPKSYFETFGEVWLPVGVQPGPYEDAVRAVVVSAAVAKGLRIVLYAPAILAPADVTALVTGSHQSDGAFTLEGEVNQLDESASEAKRKLLSGYDSLPGPIALGISLPGCPINIEHIWRMKGSQKLIGQ